MSKYAAIDDARRAQLYGAWVTVAILCVLSAGLGYGWYSAPSRLRIDIPPNLQHGAVVKPGEYFRETVKAFTYMTFRDLNRWYEDGYHDYGQNIFEHQHALTPRYREWLVRDMELKAQAGELKDRVRFMLELKEPERDQDVQQFDDGSWLVHVRVMVVERISGTEVKRVAVNYPLRVVRMNISPKLNHWGLAIDGYPAGMEETRIEDAEVSDSA